MLKNGKISEKVGIIGRKIMKVFLLKFTTD